MSDPRARLEELRARARLEELRVKAGGSAPAPQQPTAIQPQAPVAANASDGSFTLDALADWFNNSSGNPAFEQALQGATLGFSDELQGVLGAAYDAVQGKDFGDSYDARVGAIRDGMKKWADENPWSTIAANLAGGLVSGGAALRGAKTAGVPVAGVKGVLATGAALGGVAGAGTAEGGLDARVEGATLGAVLGGILTGASGAVRGVWRKLAPGVQNRVVTMANETGMTPSQIATRLQALGPKATLADVDDIFLRAGDVAAGRLGPNAKRVRELIRRDETQFSRLMEPIRRTLGGQEQAIKTVSQLKDLRMSQASPLYEAAFENGVAMTPRLKDLLSRPETAKAWRKVQKIGQSDPDLDPALLLKDADPSLRGWQEVTEQLWDRVESLKRDGKSKLAGKIRNLRQAVLDELDAQSPLYRDARKLWAGTRAADDALDMGRKLFKADIDDIRAAMAKMTDGEKSVLSLRRGARH